MNEASSSLEQSRNLRARGAAQAAAERLAVTPTGIVRYTSRGRVLVIGGEAAQWCAARLQTPLHAELLLTDGAEESGVPATAVGGRALSISGHLGAFKVELGEQGRHNYQRFEADLVVDFSARPLFDRALPPPGYWHFGHEPQDVDAACLTLDGMVGTFEKPRYFAYDPEICAHARSGQGGCRRCIDSCPAEAIVSIGERVEVNPNLCQGGGICATVCPTGAMRYAYPGPGDTAERVRLLLQTYQRDGGTQPWLAFVAEADAADLAAVPANVLLVAVEELASVGHELWLAAIAWGARRVLLVEAGSVPPKAREALLRQLTFTHELLAGLGLPGEVLQLVDATVLDRLGELESTLPAASFAALDRKRQLASLAIDHLWQHAPARPSSIALTPGAPYGRVRVDTDSCTLCMSCTSVCPAQALSAGEEVPRLMLFESNCVQCSICANSCPERAITLESRYLADPERRRQAVVLYEEPPFCCVSCGKPFATRRTIDNILEKLNGHAMFQSERARRRLQMCEDCRVVDAVQDAEAMQSGVFGATNHSSKGRA